MTRVDIEQEIIWSTSLRHEIADRKIECKRRVSLSRKSIDDIPLHSIPVELHENVCKIIFQRDHSDVVIAPMKHKHRNVLEWHLCLRQALFDPVRNFSDCGLEIVGVLSTDVGSSWVSW